jgi:hypothetical protein
MISTASTIEGTIRPLVPIRRMRAAYLRKPQTRAGRLVGRCNLGHCAILGGHRRIEEWWVSAFS